MRAPRRGAEIVWTDPLVEVASLGNLDTTRLFGSPTRSDWSPLDVFLSNTSTLNTIFVRFGGDDLPWVPELGNLILQGYMSAVESYVRAVIVGLVHLDPIARGLVEDKHVNFGLVRDGHDPRLLPESLLEHISFATAGKIAEALATFLGLKELSSEMKVMEAEFRKLCEMRHCCVHRFGKLGSKNARELGIETHRDRIGHPFHLSKTDTDLVAAISDAYVKTLNNFLFRKVLDRSRAPDHPASWRWDYRRDRKRFDAYYHLFASTHFQPTSRPARDYYDAFRGTHRRSSRPAGGDRSARRPA